MGACECSTQALCVCVSSSPDTGTAARPRRPRKKTWFGWSGMDPHPEKFGWIGDQDPR